MDLRHVSYLVAETLNLAGVNLLAEDAGTVQARVAILGEESGVVLLAVECREYELTGAEAPTRPARRTSFRGVQGRVTMYKKVRLSTPFRYGAITIISLDFALGE